MNTELCTQLSPTLCPKGPGVPYSLEIMDDVCRITPSKLGHWDIDLLIVLLNVDLDIFVQLQLPFEGRVQRVFVQDTAVEHALMGKLWGQTRQGHNTHTPNSYSKHGQECTPAGENIHQILEDILRSIFLPENILGEPSANYPCEMIISHFMLARSTGNKELPAGFHEE